MKSNGFKIIIIIIIIIMLTAHKKPKIEGNKTLYKEIQFS